MNAESPREHEPDSHQPHSDADPADAPSTEQDATPQASDTETDTAVAREPKAAEAPSPEAAGAGKSARRWRWTLALVALVALIAALPSLIAHTQLRDVILNHVFNDPHLVLTSDSATFGWFSDVQVRGIELKTEGEPTQIEVERLQLNKTWIEILLSRPDLGDMEMQRPFIDLVLEDMKGRKPRPRSDTTLRAVVSDAQLRVRVDADSEPVIDLEDLHLTLTIKPHETAFGRVLLISPITVFDHRPISPEQFRDGLQLVTPLLANDVRANGEWSFRIDEFEVPLDIEDQRRRLELTRIGGVVELHQVDAGLQNRVLQSIISLVGELLSLPDLKSIRVAENAQVEFEVRDGRVFHEGLVFAFPELAPDLWFESTGTVGLDETLDLQVSGYFPVNLLNSNELARELSRLPITLRIRGTLDDPEVKLPMNQAWIRTIGGKLLTGDLSDDGKQMADDIMTLVEAVANRDEASADKDDSPSLPQAIFNVIQSGRKLAAERRAQRQAEREAKQAEKAQKKAEKKKARTETQPEQSEPEQSEP